MYPQADKGVVCPFCRSFIDMYEPIDPRYVTQLLQSRQPTRPPARPPLAEPRPAPNQEASSARSNVPARAACQHASAAAHKAAQERLGVSDKVLAHVLCCGAQRSALLRGSLRAYL